MRLAILSILVLSLGAVAQADIIAWNCAPDNDGAIVMGTPAWGEDAEGYHVLMTGAQYSSPAHIAGDFTTDTELDPTVWIVEAVDNSTGFAWTGYTFTIGMNKPFSIIGVISPNDWTYNISAPTGGQQLPNQPVGTLGYVGTVDYTGGTSIPVGGSGNFGVIVSFLGSVEFCTEQTALPEPATALLLGFGGLSLIRRRR